MATALFSPTLIVGLGAVLALGLALDGGERKGTWLQHQAEGQPLVQSRLARWHSQESTRLHIAVGGCVQHRWATRGFGSVSGDPCLGPSVLSLCVILYIGLGFLVKCMGEQFF